MPLKGGKRKTRRNYKRKTFRRKQKKRKTRRKSRKSKKRRTRRRRKRNMRGGATTLQEQVNMVNYIFKKFKIISDNIGAGKSNSVARNTLNDLRQYKDIPFPVYRLDARKKGQKAIHFYKLTIEDNDTTDPKFTLEREIKKIEVSCPMVGSCKRKKDGKVLDLKLANEIVKEEKGVYESLIKMIDEVYEYATKDPSYWRTVPAPFQKNNQETPEAKKERQERQRLIAEEREKEVQDRDKKIEQVKEEQKAFSAQIAKDQAESNPYNKYENMTDDEIKEEYNRQKAIRNPSSNANNMENRTAVRDLAKTFQVQIVEAFNKSEDLKKFFTDEFNEYAESAAKYGAIKKKYE